MKLIMWLLLMACTTHQPPELVSERVPANSDLFDLDKDGKLDEIVITQDQQKIDIYLSTGIKSSNSLLISPQEVTSLEKKDKASVVIRAEFSFGAFSGFKDYTVGLRDHDLRLNHWLISYDFQGKETTCEVNLRSGELKINGKVSKSKNQADRIDNITFDKITSDYIPSGCKNVIEGL